MFSDSVPTTFWLVTTNVLLALAVVLCLAMILWCLVKDIKRLRRERKYESLVPLDFLDGLRSMGVVFRDGHKEIDEMVEE